MKSTEEQQRQGTSFYLSVSDDSKKSDLYEPSKKFDLTKSNEELMIASNKATLEEIQAKYGVDRAIGVSGTADAPLIAILSQPSSDSIRKTFNYDEYVLAINYKFIAMSGARPVFISYLSDDEADEKRLYQILEQVNGVLFTGGNLTLIDQESGETHAYYRTAKKIVEYSIKVKDTQNIDFPILGICQGFELLAIVASNNQKDLLKAVKVSNETLPISWVHSNDKVREESRTFSGFSQELIETMSKEKVAIHFHNWSVLESDYLAIDSLNAFYKLISVNQHPDGMRYVTGFEAHKYPIYSVIYHPEYQMMMNPNPVTLAIAKGFSDLIYNEAKKHYHQRQSLLKQDSILPEAVDSACTLGMYAFMPGVFLTLWGINRPDYLKRQQEQNRANL